MAAWGDKAMTVGQAKELGFVKSKGGTWEIPLRVLSARDALASRRFSRLLAV
jgi:hypothetical protein